MLFFCPITSQKCWCRALHAPYNKLFGSKRPTCMCQQVCRLRSSGWESIGNPLNIPVFCALAPVFAVVLTLPLLLPSPFSGIKPLIFWKNDFLFLFVFLLGIYFSGGTFVFVFGLRVRAERPRRVGLNTWTVKEFSTQQNNHCARKLFHCSKTGCRSS